MPLLIMTIPRQITYLREFLTGAILPFMMRLQTAKPANGRVNSVLSLPLQRPIHPPIIKVPGKRRQRHIYMLRPDQKTYNTRDSLVVTDPTTSLAVTGLSMGERTGSRVLQYLWSYVKDQRAHAVHLAQGVVVSTQHRGKSIHDGTRRA
ncbi:hypothetical protein B0T18DRAFT_417565 [Schizothecium vesticola]|uniref:Uncharacterized protein n=1 Tax=Schizothecium vesticola TaxID=314040 RepID=A0AA40JYM6_9PEZI|nr:hypothetical protein B0T18DRAFT_417565 [Schizothecium vesticola]